MVLHKKEETICLELGDRSGLAHCYWYWGLLAREQRDRKTEREKLAASLDLFSELDMARERDAVRAELEKTTDNPDQTSYPPKRRQRPEGAPGARSHRA